jgi:hypothetical protein
MAQPIVAATGRLAFDRLIGEGGALHGVFLGQYASLRYLLDLHHPHTLLVDTTKVLHAPDRLDAVQSSGIEVEAYALELAIPAFGEGASVDELVPLLGQVLSYQCDDDQT